MYFHAEPDSSQRSILSSVASVDSFNSERFAGSARDNVSPVNTMGADAARFVLELMSILDKVESEPKPRLPLAVTALATSDRLLAFASLVPMLVVIVEEKDASSFNAAASSFKVFNAPGAESINEVTSESTYALIDC